MSHEFLTFDPFGVCLWLNATAIAVHVVCACAYGTSESYAFGTASPNGHAESLSGHASRTRTTNASRSWGKPPRPRWLNV
ncbi:MAG: hypothetical protein KME57_00365 [Scytonema hyalinum WJT4-NPBG1]|nr:hypothetical protein [Scytonema hyalinum WJT4-NPBG1]